jgi:NAD(P)-dependent dehydrogenase (short-subunit alcohol dehydrogenase family)
MLADACLGDAAPDYPHASRRDLEETAAACAAGGAAAVATTVADVRNDAEVQSLAEDCVSFLGGIDVLANCAGIIGPAEPTHLLKESDWIRVVDTNLTGAWRCLRAAVPFMIERGVGGAVINVASTAGVVAFPHFSSYVAAKHGLVGFTKAAAVDLAPHKIRVNVVCPTSLRSTGGTNSMLGGVSSMLGLSLEEYESTILANHPLGGLPADDDAAAAIVWLASDEAQFVTGSTLLVDAGFSAR